MQESAASSLCWMEVQPGSDSLFPSLQRLSAETSPSEGPDNEQRYNLVQVLRSLHTTHKWAVGTSVICSLILSRIFLLIPTMFQF